LKVLVGKTFGLGNAILSLPMIKAICTVADEVHVMVGNGPDDYGAVEVFRTLSNSCFRPSGFGLRTEPPAHFEKFDVAVMAIPFDGRWQNGIDFVADRVVDGRKRPDNVQRLGFDMWKKHEVLYQMENAYELGYSGTIPGSRFFGAEEGDIDLVYLGIGYKRDPGGFGLSKHFGNERFVQLLNEIRLRRPTVRFVSTGVVADLIQVGAQIMKRIADPLVYRCETGSGLPYAFTVIGRCGSYIGNDTGMMHVAASLGIPTYGLFLSEDLVRKNHPWATDWSSSLLDADIGEIADRFVNMVWGKK
jgi:hypothetical protein